MVFEPRKVKINNVPKWLSQSHLLIKRRPISFYAIGFAYVLLSVCTDYIGFYTFLFIVPLLCLGCWIAQAADESCTVRHLVFRASKHSIYRVIGSGLFIIFSFLIVALASFSIVYILVTVLGAPSGSAPPTNNDIPPVSLFSGTTHNEPTFASIAGSFAVFPIVLYTGMSGFMFWFFVPLVTNSGIGYRISMHQCWKAISLNKFMFIVWLVGYSTLILVYILPLLIVPWIAYTCAIMYVCYCDIWLHRRNVKQPIVIANANKTTLMYA